LILLEDAIQKDRGWLLAHPEYEIDDKTAQLLQKQIERRAKHEPLAYIRGKTEFYGREFFVNRHTLEPRPESETIIELLKAQLRERKGENIIIADIGTGSGCLAITAKLEFPNATVMATEINDAALKIARKNAQKLVADIDFCKGNLLDPLLSSIYKLPTTILANLPYVPDDYAVNQAATHEPSLAIFGGQDGLDLYRTLFSQLSTGSYGKPVVLTESLPFQHETLTTIARSYGYSQTAEEDFIQMFCRQTDLA